MPSPASSPSNCIRYIAPWRGWVNEEQAHKDRADREAIVQSLREQLRHGDKALVGNKGYRKYLQSQGPKFQGQRTLRAYPRTTGRLST
jgi:hypothetical protein